MKLQLTDTRLLKESVGLISELVSEVCFKIDKEKMALVATDPANVAMVVFRLYANAFAEYDVQSPVNIAVNLENFKAILKRAKPEDSVTLSLDDDKSRLNIILGGAGKRSFNLALLDSDLEEQKMPNLKFTAEVSLPSQRFDDAVEDMQIVSDSAALIATPEKFVVKAEGNLSDACIEMPASSEVEVKLANEEEVEAKYALSYLLKMVGGAKLADRVKIEFAQDYPLKLTYALENKLEMAFILAPRVSND